MALVKCKECGEQVSTKAKNCQNCGAKAPKKTSLFTWLVLIVIVFVGWSAIQSPSTTSSNTARNNPGSSGSSGTGTRIPPAEPSWRTQISKDEMTGKQSAYAVSPRVRSKSPMEFPYSGTQAWLAIGCEGNSEWAYFGFTEAPNLNNTDTQDGYNVVKTRVRWDDNVQTTSFTQKWGDSFLHFRDYGPAVAKVAGANSVMLELDWHGQRPVHFEISLNGSSKAIQDMRQKCR